MLTANRVQKIFDSLNSARWPSAWAWPDPWDNVFSEVFNIPTETRRPRIWSTEDSVRLEIDLPGRQLEDIAVSLEQNILTVTVTGPMYADEKDWKFRIRERSDGRETLQFRLPFAVRADQADVVYRHGVLQISVQKPEEERPRKVAVKQG